MKRLTLILLVTLFACNLKAQTFEVPKDIKLEKASDYANYETDVIKAVDWLAATAPGKETSKRKEVSAFLMVYLTGSPDVSIGISAGIVTFMESSPDMLMLFMGGWAKHSLQNKDKEAVNGNIAGLEAIMAYYTQHKGSMKRDKNIEKYIKMKSKGKLKAYVEKNAE